MAKIDFKSLSPEEVAALNSKDKANYDKWLAKQAPGSDESEESEEGNEPETEVEEEMVEVVALIGGLTTTKFGNIPEGKKGKVSKAFAEQIIAAGHAKLAE